MKVKQVIKILEANGWELMRINGSHRQYKHDHNPNVVTVSGKPNIDVPVGTLANVRRDSGVKELR